MSFILGMDTGGTYTDGVIVTSAGRKIVCKSKTLTTKEDLTIGIKHCIERLNFREMKDVTRVALSTTLATNAIIEGRGAEVGLLYMGADLEEAVPVSNVKKIKGRFDIMGRPVEELDREQARRVLSEMKGQIEALAVSGYASVRNPKHEQEVRKMAEEILGIPVVCAHQLTSALGFQHRTVTAVLNAKLIPIIEDLLYSVKMVLREKGIRAPIMVVKGDGTLMTEEVAKEKPVETVLSGPAASVIGALALTGRKDGVVVDMGGTTTDIASVSEGAVKIKKEGAKVGGWFTRVQAAEISTFGLGGDSRICLDKKGRLKIGPEKVWPLCVMGSRYPNLIHELKSFRRTGEFKAYSQQEADCFMTGGKTLPKTASDLEAKILDQLKDGPHSLTFLAKAVGKAPETIDLTSLVEAGVLTRISVTPTDLLHVKGTYTRWDRDISYKGVHILANRMELSVSDFLEMAEKAILSKMALCFIQSAADFDGESFDFRESPEAMYLIEAAFKNRSLSLLRTKLGLGKPLVAIGAPAGAWARDAGKLLGAEVIVPENADVANAYGAAAGQVIEKAELLISADGNGFILNTPWKRYVYSSREEAMFYAIHEGRRHIEHILMDAGCRSWKIEEASSDIMAPAKEDKPRVYMGTKLIITGTGTVL